MRSAIFSADSEEVARLELLVDAAGRLFGTLDLDEVLPEVLALARDTLAADAYALWSRDAGGDTWSLRASEGLSAEYVNAAPLAIQGNTTRSRSTARSSSTTSRRPDWLTDEHKAAHAAEGTHAMLAMPLRHRGEVLGTLVFYSRRAAASATSSCARRAQPRASLRLRSGRPRCTRSRRASPRTAA